MFCVSFEEKQTAKFTWTNDMTKLKDDPVYILLFKSHIWDSHHA